MIKIGTAVKIDPDHGFDTLGNFVVSRFKGTVIDVLTLPEFEHLDIIGVEWEVVPHLSIIAAHFRNHLVEL